MKKLFVLAVMIFALAFNVESMAQSKQALKAAKGRAKELAAEGWKVEGIGSLQAELAKIEEKRSECEVLVGSSYGNKKLTLAKAQARNNAINEYAEYQKSIVKGRVNSGMSALNGQEADNLVSGFERLVLHELNGEITLPALVLYRERPDGQMDCQCFYLIDQNNVEKMRRQAIDQAIDELGKANEYGNNVSDFINEGFKGLE